MTTLVVIDGSHIEPSAIGQNNFKTGRTFKMIGIGSKSRPLSRAFPITLADLVVPAASVHSGILFTLKYSAELVICDARFDYGVTQLYVDLIDSLHALEHNCDPTRIRRRHTTIAPVFSGAHVPNVLAKFIADLKNLLHFDCRLGNGY